MKPTLIICIGGSGMKIGHAMKYNFHRYMPEALLSADGATGRIKFCFIENDKNEFERIKPYYRNIKEIFDPKEIIQIGGINANTIVTEIKKKKKDKKKLTVLEEDIDVWRDDKVHFQDIITETGLAANRQLGRMACAVGFDILKTTLEGYKTYLNSAGSKDGNSSQDVNETSIYIISGICGGTGSSMFFDISALVDNIFGTVNSPKKEAFFINTNYFLQQKISTGQYSTESPEYKNLQINTWALINECEFFLKESVNNQSMMGQYTARNSMHKTRVDEGRPYLPFTNAFLFDINCSNGRTIPLGEFYYTVADMIFYTMTSASLAQFESNVTTNKFMQTGGKSDYIDYSSIAFKTIKFPTTEFRLYFEYRYLYEIYKDGLLKKDIKEQVIEEKVKDFFNNVFEDNVTSIFAKNIQDFQSKLNIQFDQIESITSLEQYLVGDSETKLIGKETFSEIFNSHRALVSGLKNEFINSLKNLPSHGFDQAYNTRSTTADILRKRLWEHTQQVILSQGYFAVLGLNEGNIIVKGFLQEIYERIQKYYKELTLFKCNFSADQLLNEVETARINFRTKLEKRAKNFNDIQQEAEIYHRAIQNYRDQLLEFFYNQIRQEVLYYFAVGDDASNIKDSFFAQVLSNKTELKKYREVISRGVGTLRENNDDTSCLIWAFDKGQSDLNAKTIRNNYLRFLPNEWDETKNDLFTVNIPDNLYSFIDSSTERWKSNTVIDDKFKRNIKTGSEGLQSIFGEDLINSEFLLARLGEKKENINDDLRKINKRIKNKFVELYINNKISPISIFLDQNIQAAYDNSNDDVQQIIRSEFNNLVYPIRDVTSMRNIIPYANINNSDKSFLTKDLQFDPNRIVAQEKLPSNQIVLIGLVSDIYYENISECKTSKIVYEKRDLGKYRPHLNAEWNNYIHGPYGALDTDSESYPLSDSFLISYFFEKLIEKAPEVGKLIFVEKDRILARMNGKRSMPVSYNPKINNFTYFSVGKTETDENGSDKFYVEVNSSNSGGNILGKLFESLEFEKAFKELKKDGNFNECFNAFISVVVECKEDIAGAITQDINNSVSEEIFKTKQQLDKKANKSKSIGVSDNEFIRDFSAKTKSLIDNLLEINLDL